MSAAIRSSSPHRPRAGRLFVALLVVGTAAVLALLGTRSVGASAQAAGDRRSIAGRDDAESGRTVFLRDCAWCHGTTGSGTGNGPDLRNAGAAAADFYLRTGRMPLSSPDHDVRRGEPAYDDATIDALVAYVASLGNGTAAPAVGPGDIVDGRSLFLENCAACHSSSGTGTIVSGGRPAPELWQTDPRQVAEAIRIGPGPMPPFSESQLDQKELDDIVSYVEDLGAPQTPGGAGLDQYGPIAEGLVALLLLLPAVAVIARLLGKRAPRVDR